VWQPCELLYTCYYTDGPWPHDPFTCSAHPLILRRLHLAVSIQHRSGVRPSSHVSVCSVEQILNATLEESAVARSAYVAALLCEGWGSKPTAVGRSQLLARWPGTHSRILSGLQRAAQTVSGVYLKRTCSRVTSASSALAVLSDYALYKSTHALTHSLSRNVDTDRYPTPLLRILSVGGQSPVSLVATTIQPVVGTSRRDVATSLMQSTTSAAKQPRWRRRRRWWVEAAATGTKTDGRTDGRWILGE